MKYTLISPTNEFDEQLVYKSLMQLTENDVLVVRHDYSEATTNIKSMAERLGIGIEVLKDPMAVAEKVIILGTFSNDEISRTRRKNI